MCATSLFFTLWSAFVIFAIGVLRKQKDITFPFRRTVMFNQTQAIGRCKEAHQGQTRSYMFKDIFHRCKVTKKK